jgi:pimeloyl-ACP methyl ester carboxylesterase
VRSKAILAPRTTATRELGRRKLGEEGENDQDREEKQALHHFTAAAGAWVVTVSFRLASLRGHGHDGTLGPGQKGWLWYVPATVERDLTGAGGGGGMTETAIDGGTSSATGSPNLASDVAAALAAPSPPLELTVEAAGIPFHALAWGAADAPPVLLLHGVTSAARTWWRVGPAVAAAGFRVVAPDLPGHGKTGHWQGHYRLPDNAADLVAFATAAGPERPDLRIVGHSWGAATAAAMPAAGLVPATLVLIDPPAIPLAALEAMLEDPTEGAYDDVDEAVATVGRMNPTWSEGDVLAKAEGLTQFDEAAVRDILTRNGDWDGGLGALGDPAAQDVTVWLIRGDPLFGGYVPDALLPDFAARLGPERIITIAGGPHSPHRTHPEALVAAVLRALSG